MTEELPLLAYVYHPRSFGVHGLVAAAQGRCRLLWVIDTSDDEVVSMARLLRRFGDCVDVAGLSLMAASDAVAVYHPEHLLALADDCLVFASKLAQQLNIRFTTPEVAQRFTDKHTQRVALAQGGLVVPRQWVIDPHVEEVFDEISRETRFPAVLKPRRGEASRDTFPVTSFVALQELWDSEGFNNSDRMFVLEEYIPDASEPLAGREFAGYVSVETVVQGFKIRHLAINGRMPPAFPFRETGFFIPAALDDELASAVLDVAAQGARALHVQDGCLHTEIKLTTSGPQIIEVNGRIGGGVPEMLLASTGIDLMALAFDIALGNEVEMDLPVPSPQRLAYLFYVQSPPEMRRVTSVEGLEKLREVEGVEEIVLNRGPGRNVSWRDGNHGHVFSVLGTTSNHEELRCINALISRLVRIEGS